MWCNNVWLWGQRTTANISTGIGLLLVLGGILYLLAGFLAALDAISFQDRVLRIVGDDNRMQTRSVLNKLDEIRRIETSDRPKDAEGLPIETLALQLDRVKATTTLLASFKDSIKDLDIPSSRARKTENQSDIVEEWLTKTESNSPPEQVKKEITKLLQQLGLVDENQLAQIDTEDFMQDLGNNLKYELNQLDNQISDSVSGIKLVRNIKKIQNIFEYFDTNQAPLLASSDESATTVTPLAINSAAVVLKQKLDQLESGLLQLDNTISVNGAERDIVDQYLSNALEVFNKIRPLTAGSTKQIRGNLEEILTLVETIRSDVAAIEDAIGLPEPAVMDELFRNLQASASTFDTDMATADYSAKSNWLKKQNNPLKEIEAQTTELAGYVETTMPEIDTIQKITPALAEMEIATNALSTLILDPDNINIIIDGQTVSGLEGANLYKQQVDALSKAVSAMTTSLQELSDEGLLAQLLADDPEALGKAATLLRDHEKISRAEFPLSIMGWKVIDPSSLAVASREKLDIMLVLIVGAIGSMIYMTQRMLKMMMHRQSRDMSQRLPFLWYFARPVFGAVVAFAFYLIYQTGQVAFGTGGLTEALQNGINIPILTVLGLFAGLLSWQALDMIQSKGEVWMKSGTRKPMWATGLARVLEAKDQTEESCSQHLGVSIGQVDRWIKYKDMVVPEMQDRLSTWLNVKTEDLFSATLLTDTENQMPMYAIGLKPFLQRINAHKSLDQIARALSVKVEIVERWRDQKQPVSSEYQWQLLALVEERFAQFYSSKAQSNKNWAVKLRECMAKSDCRTATQLASKLYIDEEWVKKWRDLYEPVPEPTARLIADTLQDDFYVLFDPHFDRLKDQYMVANMSLSKAIARKYTKTKSRSNDSVELAKTGSASANNTDVIDYELNNSDSGANAVSEFAKDMDVSEKWVKEWLNGEKPLFGPTRKAVALKLEMNENELFKRLKAKNTPSRDSRPANESGLFEEAQ